MKNINVALSAQSSAPLKSKDFFPALDQLSTDPEAINFISRNCSKESEGKVCSLWLEDDRQSDALDEALQKRLASAPLELTGTAVAKLLSPQKRSSRKWEVPAVDIMADILMNGLSVSAVLDYFLAEKGQSNPVVAVIATPQNVDDIRRGTESFLGFPPGARSNTFAVVFVNMPDDCEFIDPLDILEIQTTANVEELKDWIANKRIAVFSSEDAELVQKVAPDPVRHWPGFVIETRGTMMKIDRTDDQDLYSIGSQGAALCKRPMNLHEVTPELALSWVFETLSVVCNFNFEMQRISMNNYG